MVEDHDSERYTDVVDAVSPASDGDDDPVGMRVHPGLEVGGYVIDGELGYGGMGVVYSATHPVIGKRAAIKILRPEVSRSPVAVARFIQEARAVNQIGHPNIVDIFAYGALPDGRAYHVMDLLVGESLRRRLKRDVLHPSEAASVIGEIASALIAAHDHGFVHRDLKPDNVFLVTHDGRWPEVKLLDFGLAKLMPEHGVSAFTTKTGVMLGTPEYMSPEQARGVGVDYRTDIYALGIVMFEILAGARPFPSVGDPLATLLQHAEEPPMSLADVVSGLPDEMVQLVAAMLAKTPEARPSLAAVRTVIKRLRTTQLPTRSVAGLAMATFSQPSLPPLAISPSRVGAAPMLPGDPSPGDPRMSGLQPMTTPGVGMGSFRGSNPSLPRVSHPSQPPPSRPSQPPSGGASASRSQPPMQSHPPPASQAPGQTSGSGQAAGHAASQTSPPGHAASQTSPPGQPPSLTASHPGVPRSMFPSAPPDGLRAQPVGSQPLSRSFDGPPARLPSTTLGVAVPVLTPPKTRPPDSVSGLAPLQANASAVTAPAPRPRRTGLLLAVLFGIAGGIAAIIALVGI